VLFDGDGGGWRGKGFFYDVTMFSVLLVLCFVGEHVVLRIFPRAVPDDRSG